MALNLLTQYLRIRIQGLGEEALSLDSFKRAAHTTDVPLGVLRMLDYHVSHDMSTGL